LTEDEEQQAKVDGADDFSDWVIWYVFVCVLDHEFDLGLYRLARKISECPLLHQAFWAADSNLHLWDKNAEAAFLPPIRQTVCRQ
jgi:hypothetical protein